ncbi:MAG: hypothetical protein R3D55_07980 [Chloroflexota bacterium]
MAQAITSFLRDKGATTFIATHYPELKLYADQQRGAIASMLFDVETLSPPTKWRLAFRANQCLCYLPGGWGWMKPSSTMR